MSGQTWAVILAGGTGSRFWPLSTPSRPKQVLPLAGDRSCAEEAMRRLDGLVPPERVLLVTNRGLAGPLQRALGVPDANVLVEPRAASTAPALVWATMEAGRRDPEARVLSMHADWHVPDAAAFRATARTALDAAEQHDLLCTVGMAPSRPETGFGYIVPDGPIDADTARVARFIEKPDAATAAALIAEGALWNSGLFAWTAARLEAEIEAHTPEVAPALVPLRAGDVDAFFAQVGAVSIDVGLLERSDRVGVVRGAFAWDDVGTWLSLTRVRPADAHGNIVVGPATLHNCHHCIVWATDAPLVVSDMRGVIVVQANGRTLVCDRSRAPDLKTLLDLLPPQVRDLP
jgi:mannose-1-phosphate guanylyltransferase